MRRKGLNRFKNVTFGYLIILCGVMGYVVWRERDNKCPKNENWFIFLVGTLVIALLFCVFGAFGKILGYCLRKCCESIDEDGSGGTKCQICCRGVCLNPLPWGLIYTCWGFYEWLFELNKCKKETYLYFGFLLCCVMIVIAVLLTSVFFFCTVQYSTKKKAGQISERDDGPAKKGDAVARMASEYQVAPGVQGQEQANMAAQMNGNMAMPNGMGMMAPNMNMYNMMQMNGSNMNMQMQMQMQQGMINPMMNPAMNPMMAGMANPNMMNAMMDPMMMQAAMLNGMDGSAMALHTGQASEEVEIPAGPDEGEGGATDAFPQPAMQYNPPADDYHHMVSQDPQQGGNPNAVAAAEAQPAPAEPALAQAEEADPFDMFQHQISIADDVGDGPDSPQGGPPPEEEVSFSVELSVEIDDNAAPGHGGVVPQSSNDLLLEMAPAPQGNAIPEDEEDLGPSLERVPSVPSQQRLGHKSRPSESISIRDITQKELLTRTATAGGLGEDVELSFPSEVLGYARRLSSGIINVIKLTDPDVECVICCSEFEKGEAMAQLNCGHMFHRECVIEWLQEKQECPYCRMDVKNYTKGGVPDDN